MKTGLNQDITFLISGKDELRNPKSLNTEEISSWLGEADSFLRNIQNLYFHERPEWIVRQSGNVIGSFNLNDLTDIEFWHHWNLLGRSEVKT